MLNHQDDEELRDLREAAGVGIPPRIKRKIIAFVVTVPVAFAGSILWDRHAVKAALAESGCADVSISKTGHARLDENHEIDIYTASGCNSTFEVRLQPVFRDHGVGLPNVTEVSTSYTVQAEDVPAFVAKLRADGIVQ